MCTFNQTLSLGIFTLVLGLLAPQWLRATPPDTLKLELEGSTSLTARVGDVIWVEEYTAEDELGKVTVSLLTFDKAKLALIGSEGGEVFGGGKRWNNIYFEVLKPGTIRLKLDFRFADYAAGEEYNDPLVFEIVAE